MKSYVLFLIFVSCFASAVYSSETPFAGTWRSQCLNIGERDGNPLRVIGTLQCTQSSCKTRSDLYSGLDCDGEVLETQTGSIGYEIERQVSENLYDIKVWEDDLPVCYRRVQFADDNRLYFVLADEGSDHDCTTPERRQTEINVNNPLIRIGS